MECGRDASSSKLALAKELEKPDNAICADCDHPSPTWAVRNVGCFICIVCAGVHRSLGVGTSEVRSVELDHWTLECVRGMHGNAVVNAQLEYCVPNEQRKPVRSTGQEERRLYISAKYKEKLFIQREGLVRQGPVYDKADESCGKQRAEAMVETKGVVFITLLSAQDLRAADLNGKSDAYCIFSNARQSVKSKVVPKSLNPDFKREGLSLCMEGLTEPISLKVMDYDRLSPDDPLGDATIDVSGLKSGVPEKVSCVGRFLFLCCGKYCLFFTLTRISLRCSAGSN